MNPITFIIRRDDALALQVLAATDESRYAIMGVHFECINKHLTLTATNGRQLGVLNVGKIEVEEDFSFVADLRNLRFLKVNKERPKIQVQVCEKEIWLSNKSGKIASDKIDGVYPKWKQVVPSDPFTPHAPVVDVDFLCAFRDVAKLLSGNNPCPITFRLHGDGGPISVFLSDERFYGIQMPVRSDRKYTVPEWVCTTNPEQQKAA